MKPLRLYLKGFVGITSGLQKPEINLDLTVIPDSATLVALVAPNGKGKSTILDNLHPYRIMPGRTRGIKPSAFSYWNELCAPVAEKRLDWEHRGVVYRTHLVFKSSGKTQTQSAYLLQQRGDEWEPVKLSDGAVSDGSAAAYDRCVEQIVGRSEVFLTTAFAAWKRTMLSGYDTGDIKKLLSVWLNVDSLLKTSADASEVAALLQANLDECHSKLREAETLEAAARTGIEVRQTLTEKIAVQSAAVDQAEAQAEQLRQAVVRLDAQIEGMRNVERQRAELGHQIETERRRGDVQERDIRGHSNTTLDAYREQDRDLEKAVSTATDELSGLRTQLGTIVKRIAGEANVIAASHRIEVIQKQQSEIASDLERVRAQIASLRPHREAVTRQTAVQAHAETTGLATRRRIDQIKVVAALAEKVPCANSALQGKCELLKDAHEARSQLHAVQAELMKLRGEYRGAAKLLEVAGVEVKNLEALEAREDALRKQQDAIAKEIGTLSANVAMGPLIAEAKRLHPEVEVAIAAKQKSITEAGDRRTACQASMKALVTEVEQKVAAAKQGTAQSVAEVQSRLAALPAGIDANARTTALEKRDLAERAIVDLKNCLGTFRAQLTESDRQLAQVQVRLEQLEPVRKVASALTAEIARWHLTALAAGKNGLVAFSIDDAGPEISSIANDLLMKCYDGSFVVRFATQHELRNGETREGFDIKVRDIQGGAEKSIDDLSGGQEVYVNECVTRAVALYLAQSGSYQFDTLFTDEADGPLDEDRKRKFVAMKRMVLELGQYGREYFVTQTKELQGMADYVIDVAAL